MNDVVSLCCRKPVKVEGDVTHFYTCSGCGKPTDAMRLEAIVGVNSEGFVRALFCIDSDQDDKKAGRIKANWEQAGRTVHRCSQTYAFDISGKQWVEEPK